MGCWWDKLDEPLPELISNDPATNLLVAIQHGLPQVCQALLSMNAQLDLARPLYSCYKLYLSPLLKAAVQCGEREVIQALLDAHAKHHYNGLDSLADGSAVQEAVKMNDTQTVQML